MPKYKVSYSEHRHMEIDIDADSPEEAEEMILNGDADFDQAYERDAEIASVNEVEEIEA